MLVEIVAKWDASDKLLISEAIANGEVAQRTRTIEFSFKDLSAAQREALLNVISVDEYVKDVAMNRRLVFAPGERHPYAHMKRGAVTLDNPPTFDEVLRAMVAERQVKAQVKAHEKALKAAADKKRAEMQEVYDSFLPQVTAAIERRDLDALRINGKGGIFIPGNVYIWKECTQGDSLDYIVSEARNKIRAENSETAMREWIAEFGSGHLTKANAEGYEIGRLYTLERAAREAPGWTVDFYDAHVWKERTNPSMAELEALDKARELGVGSAVNLIWLKAPPRNTPDRDLYEERYLDFEPGVALIISGYLDKYELIKIL